MAHIKEGRGSWEVSREVCLAWCVSSCVLGERPLEVYIFQDGNISVSFWTVLFGQLVLVLSLVFKVTL